jgi:phosphoribosylformylglycinamidine cyclo-ligase
MSKITYKDAGVDIEAGYEAVSLMKKHISKTMIPGVMKTPDSFFSAFELPKGYEEPVLVSSTDGVGTKLKIAIELGIHHTVGIDLVAMSVNDLICSGAKPLFFLDYIAIHKLDPKLVEQIVAGIADGCEQSGCALIGGETAEMNDMYKPGDYDLAGFAVGVVEKRKMISAKNVQKGDVVIGLPSSGLHSNGFSLARKVLTKSNYEKLLTPTKIYVKDILSLIEKFEIHAIANITGGGLPEKLGRAVPQGLEAVIDSTSWEMPEIFKRIESSGSIEKMEMFKTFNMGIGMTVIVPKEIAKDVAHFAKGFIIGEMHESSNSAGHGVKIK